MPVDATHVHALFAAIAKFADDLGEPGSQIFALAELGQGVAQKLIEAGK